MNQCVSIDRNLSRLFALGSIRTHSASFCRHQVWSVRVAQGSVYLQLIVFRIHSVGSTFTCCIAADIWLFESGNTTRKWHGFPHDSLYMNPSSPLNYCRITQIKTVKWELGFHLDWCVFHCHLRKWKSALCLAQKWRLRARFTWINSHEESSDKSWEYGHLLIKQAPI